MSVADIAEKRGIKESTAMGYLAEAISLGHGYVWPCAGITHQQTETAFKKMDLLSSTAGRLSDALTYN